jgi:hypothetical protein
MATRKLVDGHVQSFPCDAPLEVDRKESIVAPCDHVDRNLGPRFEPAGLAEYDVGLGALVRFALPDNPGRNVMQEVRDEIEVRAEAVAACGRCACCRRSGAVSPLASRLAGNRNHRIDEHQDAHANPRAHQRRCKASERLHDEYQE